MHDLVAHCRGDTPIDAPLLAGLLAEVQSLEDASEPHDGVPALRQIGVHPALGIVLLPAAAPCPNEAVDPLAPLIARIRDRDEAALGELHRALSLRLFAWALRFTHRAEIADDAVSACFQQVWNHADEFDPGRAKVSRWLHTIVRSRAIDLMRSLRARSRHECDIDEAGLSAIADAAPGPCVTLEAAQSRKSLRRAMSVLPPIQRQVLSLTFLDGLSQQEAADYIGLPLGTVKSHARRGIAILRGNARLRMVGS